MPFSMLESDASLGKMNWGTYRCNVASAEMTLTTVRCPRVLRRDTLS
jgi:hypothetical protein